MADDDPLMLQGLPPNVVTLLSEFLKTAQAAYSSDLVSAVLYGSAAEGKMGPGSDVNLLLVLTSFTPKAAGEIRDSFLTAEAAIKLRVMFVREDELGLAAEMFGQKFADIRRRHRILLGKDVISGVVIPRTAQIFRLQQVLLNLTLRLREACVARIGRPEQVTRVLADTVGPLRAASATLLELEGTKSPDATEALRSVFASFGPGSEAVLGRLMAAHDQRALPSDAQDTLFQVAELTSRLCERAQRLS
ncbi:MAG TPA: nucleotidyltransferase domain-containing protein [Candidatus Saccharimonadales bacterium]|jgi:predicted nucleotidyltransferase|nr:nucleotidyltransferase domain-containing protein [Candidatus Saccharimonadales bacterium]